MLNKRKYISCIWLLLLVLLWPASAALAQHDYVDINNPFLRKIPTAVPLFKSSSGSPTERQVAQSGADQLSEMLIFTGYFKTIDRAAFLIEGEMPNLIAPKIVFRNWTGIGAELLVTGGVLIQDDVMQMELRLYDTFKEQLLVGKRYKGGVDDQRRMIRRFCAEVIYSLTGSRGLFDSQIAFVSKVDNHKEIYICDFDGANATALTNHKSISLSPDWSYDGRYLAYTSYFKGRPDLYILHLDQRRGTPVRFKGINIAPAWRPGAAELAATLSFSGDPEIYLLTESGKITKRITHSAGIDVSASWSPDGKKMAFVSKRAGTPQIYIKDLDNGQLRRLTFVGKNNTQPSWSPRGDQIAYTAFQKGQINIRVIGLDGQAPVQLTQDAGDNESPSWSPDGSLIVFSSSRQGAIKLYVMTAFGTDQRQLLDLPGQQSEPRWSLNIGQN